MKKIVILKGALIDSLDENILCECLNIMFPECNVEICSGTSTKYPDEEMYISSVLAQKGQNTAMNIHACGEMTETLEIKKNKSLLNGFYIERSAYGDNKK